MAGIGFDVCIGDLVRALASGGTLVICPKQTLLDAPALARLIQAHGIQCAEFVPIALRHLVAHLEASGERLESLRYLIAGSDLWHAADLERTRRVAGAHTRVVNSYGLTEAAVDSTCYLVPPGHALRAHGVAPIGRPLDHASAYVLDAARQRCPIGVVGELHVGGPGLARGYLGQPALTAERFVASPFGAGRLYRTGDLARWRGDGNLELIGRIDHQVKIRGFRVELGEIEARLKAHPAVQDAVVIDVLRGEENRQLAAYVALRAGAAADAESLRAHLEASLPDYMVPAVVQMLAALPTNANGKIDRKALPAPSFDAQRDRVEPANGIETALCAYLVRVAAPGRGQHGCELLPTGRPLAAGRPPGGLDRRAVRRADRIAPGVHPPDDPGAGATDRAGGAGRRTGHPAHRPEWQPAAVVGTAPVVAGRPARARHRAIQHRAGAAPERRVVGGGAGRGAGARSYGVTRSCARPTTSATAKPGSACRIPVPSSCLASICPACRLPSASPPCKRGPVRRRAGHSISAATRCCAVWC